MKALRFIGSPAHAGYALGAVLVGAVALTALGPLVPNEALSALRALIPGETPFLELVLLGWLGVALGRLTMRAAQAPAQRGGQAAARQEAAAREEKVDRVLRHVSKVLQAHLTDSESFSSRLDGASERLSRQETVGPIKEIVLALIEDNRDMRDKLYSVRNQLEESRLQVVQLQSNLERAEEAGLRDVVTAIGNRRFFNACFIEEVEKARKGGDNLCLALTDIDKFKQVNDRFGHLVGDRLLRLFAGILVKNVRGQDKVARFGGEEFALIFPGARLAEAATAVERIRGALESKQWTIEPSGERIGKVTASFGLARLRAEESATDLLQRADQRLYEAKAHGRNCVVADREKDEASPSGRPSSGRRAAG
ncbi:MAG TPA: GGDEF domain-containing protein [Roseiarcus sp.]|nr:GGDEF domain-containing protein [Roseiarcus sp.]